MSATSEPRTFGQKIWIAVRFVLFGFLASGSCSVSRWHLRSVSLSTVSPFLSVPLSFIGALMMLFGVGEWRRWAYLWVFLSIPISFCLLALIPGTGSKELPVVVAAIAAFGSYGIVRTYYARRVQAHTHEDTTA